MKWGGEKGDVLLEKKLGDTVRDVCVDDNAKRPCLHTRCPRWKCVVSYVQFRSGFYS